MHWLIFQVMVMFNYVQLPCKRVCLLRNITCKSITITWELTIRLKISYIREDIRVRVCLVQCFKNSIKCPGNGEFISSVCPRKPGNLNIMKGWYNMCQQMTSIVISTIPTLQLISIETTPYSWEGGIKLEGI